MASVEQEMVARFKAGDAQGFATVFDAFSPRVLGFALRLTGSRSEAEDLVQEVFISAFEARDRYQRRSKLLTWLLGIAVRKWRDHCRRPCLPTVALESAEASTTDGLPGVDSLPIVGVMEDQVVSSLTLDKALSALDAPFREALLLVISQGLTYREAAQVLGEPVGTVKWRVSEASRRMREVLNHVEEEFYEMEQGETPQIQDPGHRLACKA